MAQMSASTPSLLESRIVTLTWKRFLDNIALPDAKGTREAIAVRILDKGIYNEHALCCMGRSRGTSALLARRPTVSKRPELGLVEHRSSPPIPPPLRSPWHSIAFCLHSLQLS